MRFCPHMSKGIVHRQPEMTGADGRPIAPVTGDSPSAPTVRSSAWPRRRQRADKRRERSKLPSRSAASSSTASRSAACASAASGSAASGSAGTRTAIAAQNVN